MKAAVARTPGPLAGSVSVLTVDGPGPPRPGEVRIRMTATTVNPSDAVTVSGAYPSRTVFPFVPGFEGVGVVEDDRGAAHSGSSLEGRRVLPLGGPGCWQQLRNVGRDWCVPVPDDLDDATACFSYINPLTASLMVDRFCTRPAAGRAPGTPPTVVVTAAGSAIAGHLAELLTELPLTHPGLAPVRPVGLVRRAAGHSPPVADPSRWSRIVGTAVPGWRTRLRSAVGPDGADIVLDCVGGSLGSDLTDILAPGGVLVLYGLLSGRPLPPACFDGRRGTRVEMFRLRDTVHSLPRSQLAPLFGPVFALQRRGLLRTAVATRVGLSRLTEALDAGTTGPGKLLIDPWS
ncbi:zinc-dependent alcohol dehydrogenase family protein [Corynebacterium provencense]|uniref:zinc-dependent alcohol dehydrogenase family protein n=1 Tax=Corynebacterium provencense TaxID=1737425 RepID=UPI0008338803|nr:zinc-dependent alcohol dehydrogenase family protein [Corynebacterium provencense]